MIRKLSLSFCFILAACGGSAPAPSAPASTTPTKATNPTTEATPVPEKTSKVEVPDAIKAVVDAADRDPEDKKLDGGRHPAETLAFFGIKPGMKVAELFAGTGYTSELLARAVGPSGVVYSQNNAWVREKFAEKPWAARLAKPANKNVVKVTRELDDPLPPEAKDLDAVFVLLVYHDTVWQGADRAKMNANIFKALKPGGGYAVIDHSGRPGTGSTETKTLHRIEEKVVRDEIEKAGFKLAAEADFLRNAADSRDWNPAPFAAAEKRGTSDRFVMRFVKP